MSGAESRRTRSRCAGAILMAVLTLACEPAVPLPIDIDWRPVDRLNAELPDAVRIWSGSDPSIPLRAWYVRADVDDPAIELRVAVSADDDLRETAAEFARRTDAFLVVNAGYFRSDLDPASHVGLLMVDGVIYSPALRSVLRDEQRYFLARAALGVREDANVDIAWVSSHEGALYEWLRPPQNAPERPIEALDFEGLVAWPVRHAVAGGPLLVAEGEISITSDEEVFFGSAIPGIHPRTAAGVDRDGNLLLLVVDGRQRDSRGVDLVELANLMLDLGAVEAMNLDGGGSSTLVVGGELVNRPAGAAAQREIMSALTIHQKATTGGGR